MISNHNSENKGFVNGNVVVPQQQVKNTNRNIKVTNKIALIWNDNLPRKIFLDIISNTQFRLCKYVKKDFCKLIDNMVKLGYDDNKIYTEMHTWVHSQINEKTRELLVYDNNKYRSSNRAEKIQELTKKYLNTIDCNEKDLNVLDIGCAEGAITVMVGKCMKLNPEQVHGCDIENITDDNPYQKQFTFTHLTETNNYNLPYEDNSYHVVLALMSLHHIPNKKAMIEEIRRVLKPGGLLIIREHHCVSYEFSMVLDVIHGFYSMVWSNPTEMECFDSYFAKYTRSESLSFILSKYGFVEKYNNHIKDYPRFSRGKIINPLGYYYGAYEKIP